MARTKGAKDKKPRKRRGDATPQPPVTGTKVAGPITKGEEISLPWEGNARAFLVAAAEEGLYTVHADTLSGEQEFTVNVAKMVRDELGNDLPEPYFCSAVHNLPMTKIYAEGTTAPHIVVLS